jgi:hypothetical protein
VNPWALVGLGLGATTSAIGATGLAASLWGSDKMSKRDRYTVGAVMASLLGAGAILSALSSAQLQGGRRG